MGIPVLVYRYGYTGIGIPVWVYRYWYTVMGIPICVYRYGYGYGVFLGKQELLSQHQLLLIKILQIWNFCGFFQLFMQSQEQGAPCEPLRGFVEHLPEEPRERDAQEAPMSGAECQSHLPRRCPAPPVAVPGSPHLVRHRYRTIGERSCHTGA